MNLMYEKCLYFLSQILESQVKFTQILQVRCRIWIVHIVFAMSNFNTVSMISVSELYLSVGGPECEIQIISSLEKP